MSEDAIPVFAVVQLDASRRVVGFYGMRCVWRAGIGWALAIWVVVGMGEDWVVRSGVYCGTFCVAWLGCSSSKCVIATMCVESVLKAWIFLRGL